MSLHKMLVAVTVSRASTSIPYSLWSGSIKTGECLTYGTIPCMLQDGIKTYFFPAGVFEIDEQLLIPENTSITGANSPNDMANPTRSPDWAQQTVFLATRGETDYYRNYCHASDMVRTRVGFVLSSFVTVSNVSYQGVDTIRPDDNGALCGGGAFETKGCAENDCTTPVNNGGSDGFGSISVTIRNVRLNDYYATEDQHKIGAKVDGNYNCSTNDFANECCFCKPNGVRSTQVGVWVPATRGATATRYLLLSGIVSMSSQADGVNLHGLVLDAVVQDSYFANTGDDSFALWGADLFPANVTFRDSIAVNPGILRPNWYGNCVATYGFRSALFENMTCVAPTLDHPIPQPYGNHNTTQIDISMFVFYTSFGGTYPDGNMLTISGYNFKDPDGNSYVLANGTTVDPGLSGKKVWTRSTSTGGIAPYFLPSQTQEVNVIVV